MRFNRKGQATTEVVLLFPVFMILCFFIAKIFALLVLVQKLEIASYYAARRWQLESHRNMNYYTWDNSFLRSDIERKVREYVGFNRYTTRNFLKLYRVSVPAPVRAQVWNLVTVQVTTSPARIKLLCHYPRNKVCARPYGRACLRGYDFLCVSGAKLEVTKYVPNRDRPIQYQLPGLQ
ncbi:MAG: TadE family protein [Elusimicrobiales bacterium]